ncbi:hypothetical protein LTR09_008260 [Extremus antarcticus]|uniref:Ataxin-10 homolog n=1 Tax=Extremus antarcticus TaxID=702011 RepID=A0AAJ0G747_9PEZI|nr:hypothetical protein LTR09_008260 [Extremus antarcticus]
MNLHDNEVPRAYSPARPPREFTPDEKRARAHSTFIRLALPPYTIHFKSPTYLDSTVLDLLDKRVVKETLKTTSQDVWVRTGIGTDARFWHELVLLLKAAIPSLERRSFQHWDPSSVDYDSTSGALIAGNYPGLWRDLERLNDVVSISRNLLTQGEEVQNIASSYCIDIEIFRLINCCVRVTARGYDGNANTGEEEKWQWVVNAYKKLLITSLQFLNNLVAQNEKKKCMLWTSLFDHTSETGYLEEELIPGEMPKPRKPLPPITSTDILLAYGRDENNSRVSPLEFQAAQMTFQNEGWKSLPANAAAAKKHAEPNGYVYFVSQYKDVCMEDFRAVHKRSPSLAEIHRNMPHYWHMHQADTPRMWAYWQDEFDRALLDYREDEQEWYAYHQDPKAWERDVMYGRPPPPPRRVGRSWEPKEVEQRIRELEDQMAEECKSECAGHGYCEDPVECEKKAKTSALPNPLDPRTANEKYDSRMLFTSEAGTKILESGKAELMKRLEGYADAGASVAQRRISTTRSAPLPVTGGHVAQAANTNGVHRSRSSSYAVEDAFAEESLDEDEEEEEESEEEGEEEDEEEDYPGSTEDGRGLLTDVPLILGPSEIEVLPMLIMSGHVIAPATEEPDRRNNYKNIDPTKEDAFEEALPENVLENGAKLRTHLLLSQTPGRNLLRELLIFVAAWDLREEELYFKFMVRILEAILRHGLMPYAYHAFRDRSRSKDIISPAQAVIMKLLTCIFRQRNENIRKHLRGELLEGEILSDTYLHTVKGYNVVRPTHSEKAEIDWLRKRHRIAVEEKKRLGLLPTAVDLRLLNFVFTEFRQHIIPQTCALIFLQGQIHRGRASPDDFPLNLWDMERMYEGVYQFLEFFAVLSEEQGRVPICDEGLEREIYGEIIWGAKEEEESMGGLTGTWKNILAGWEMASELVTLLRELEGGIPKVGATIPQPKAPAAQPMSASFDGKTASTPPPPPPPKPQRSMSADAAMNMAQPRPASAPTPVAIERPFDVEEDADADAEDLVSPHTIPSSLTPGGQAQQLYEAEHPLAYPEDPLNSLAPNALVAHHADLQNPHDQDEPSDFEWRNLKKLTVLVLSSLIWKNKLVQDQVRKSGGLEALVGCCRHDENNPYIREHAVMCLRFAVENCEENAQILVKLAEERGQLNGRLGARIGEKGMKRMVTDGIPKEVLDANGYETFVDTKGQTGLRRKDGVAGSSHTSAPPPPPPPPPPASAASYKASSKNMREWVARSQLELDELLPSLSAATQSYIQSLPTSSPGTSISVSGISGGQVTLGAKVTLDRSSLASSAGGSAAGSAADKGLDLLRTAMMNLPLNDSDSKGWHQFPDAQTAQMAVEGIKGMIGQEGLDLIAEEAAQQEFVEEMKRADRREAEEARRVVEDEEERRGGQGAEGNGQG